MVCSPEMVRWFLAHGANCNARCDWDRTAVSDAVYNGSLSTIYMMLQHGGDTRKGQLMHCAMKRESIDQLALIDLLIAYGAPVNARMYENDARSWMENSLFGMGTPLHAAAEQGKLALVECLLDHGADTSILDSAERTAFTLAKEGGHDDVANRIETRSISNA